MTRSQYMQLLTICKVQTSHYSERKNAEKPVEKGHGKRNGINIILWETLVARGAFVPKRCQDVNRQTVKEYFSSRIRSYKNVL